MLKATQIRELRLAVSEGLISKEQFVEYLDGKHSMGKTKEGKIAPVCEEMLKDFIENHVEKNIPIAPKELFALFIEYAAKNGIDPVGVNSLGRKLSRMGIKSKIFYDRSSKETKRVFCFPA